MERFRLDRLNLPTTFYRVQYRGTQTLYNTLTGFSARDASLYIPNNEELLRESVIRAFTWSSRIPSPYIAVFSDREHAENWAMSWSERKRRECEVFMIDTLKLDDVLVMKLSTVATELNFVLPDGASQHEEGAYLCLHHIPPQAVLGTEDTWSIRERRDQEWWAREESVSHRTKRPGTHWCGDLDGYYDTDEEAEQNNINDNIINMIEGNWA